MHIKDYLFKSGLNEKPDDYWLETRDGDYLRDTIMGHGSINFEQVFRILRQAGYQGYYSLEYCGPEAASNAVKVSAENLRRLYGRAGEPKR